MTKLSTTKTGSISKSILLHTDDNATTTEGEGQLSGRNRETAREDRVPTESNSENATGQGERTIGTRIS